MYNNIGVVLPSQKHMRFIQNCTDTIVGEAFVRGDALVFIVAFERDLLQY